MATSQVASETAKQCSDIHEKRAYIRRATHCFQRVARLKVGSIIVFPLSLYNSLFVVNQLPVKNYLLIEQIPNS